ncbi:MAG: ABC transporter permease, partial [Planctomycetes bacterium]|nr:ABC transporter permease [Planctomycetota bacterium]
MTAILAREVLDSVRSRWFVAVTAVFCVLALGVSYLSFSGANTLGFAGFNRTVASLLNLMLLFVPLMGLLVGALGLSGEREDGTLGYILAQPVSRTSVFLTKLAGQSLSLTFSIGLGLGLAGLVVGWEVGADGAAAYVTLAVDAILLGAASLALGVLVAVVSTSRMRALAVALLLWVLFAFVIDSASIGLVIADVVGPEGLLYLALLNPVQLAKVLCLLALSAKLEMLGPAGIHAVKTFGHGGALTLLAGALAAWAVVPAAIGGWFFG